MAKSPPPPPGKKPSASSAALGAVPVEPTVVRSASSAPDEGWERTVARDIVVGQTLGDYKVLRRLGSGGMGIVYEGIHAKIGRRVAIKVLRPSLAKDPKQVESLLEEARSANAVRHRGIIDIYDFGSLLGVGNYLVMEYLEGKSLEDALQSGPFSQVDAVKTAAEVADALSAAHAAHLVHRDLKPSNIFLVEEQSGGRYVKLLDFGIAKRVAPGIKEETRVERVVGTPEYMSPEQAQGFTVGPQSDLYALGCILYELLAGAPPFTGEGMQVATSQVMDEPPNLLDRAPATVPALRDLVHALIQKETADRPPSARDVRNELQKILGVLTSGGTIQQARPKSVAAMHPVPVPATTPMAVMSKKEKESRPSNERAEPAPSKKAHRLARAAEDVPLIPLPKRMPSWAPLALVGLAVVSAGAFAIKAIVSSRPVADVPVPEPYVPAAPVKVEPNDSAGKRNPPARPPERVVDETSPVKIEPKETEPGSSAAQVAANSKTMPRGSGALELDVKGAFVEIRVDGKVKGQTPWEKQVMLSAGKHKIELRALPGEEDAFRPFKTTVAIRDGQSTPLRLVLEKDKKGAYLKAQ